MSESFVKASLFKMVTLAHFNSFNRCLPERSPLYNSFLRLATWSLSLSNTTKPKQLDAQEVIVPFN